MPRPKPSSRWPARPSCPAGCCSSSPRGGGHTARLVCAVVDPGPAGRPLCGDHRRPLGRRRAGLLVPGGRADPPGPRRRPDLRRPDRVLARLARDRGRDPAHHARARDRDHRLRRPLPRPPERALVEGAGPAARRLPRLASALRGREPPEEPRPRRGAGGARAGEGDDRRPPSPPPGSSRGARTSSPSSAPGGATSSRNRCGPSRCGSLRRTCPEDREPRSRRAPPRATATPRPSWPTSTARGGRASGGGRGRAGRPRGRATPGSRGSGGGARRSPRRCPPSSRPRSPPAQAAR